MPDDSRNPSEDAPAATSADAPPVEDATASDTARKPILTVWQLVGGVFGALVMLLVLFLLLFDWNWLRGPLGRLASARAHREVRIDGDLKVHLLTWTPRIRIERLFVGQPDWAKAARPDRPFATIESTTFDVKLLPLFAGRIESPLLEIRRPSLTLYQDAKGRANWDFSDPTSPKTGKPFKLPPIQQIIIADGRLDAESVPRKARLTATVNSREQLKGGPDEAFKIVGRGSINGNPFQMDAGGGPLINVRRDRPYPFRADVRAGGTHLVAEGAIPKPFDLGLVRTKFTLTGADLNNVYDITGIPLPNSPPYSLSGDLTRDGKVYDIKGLSGRLGASDIGGHINVNTTDKRPMLRAELTSKLLDFADLAALFGAPGVSKAATPAQKAAVKTVTAGGGRLLPDATLQTARLRAMDAVVTFKADAVKPNPKLPIRGVNIGVDLDKGLLKLDPVTLTLPQGRLNGTVTLNARGETPVTDLDMSLSNVQLENYIPAVGGTRPVDGTLAARAKLHGAGNSVHRAAANADGRVTALIPRGHIRRAFAELMGIDAGKGLFLLLNKDTSETDLRCAVADFRVKNGVMTAEQIVIDTTVVVVKGKGSIKLGDESLNLVFDGKPTKFRLLRLNAPITVGGRLNNPSFGVKPGGAIAQAGIAVALAAAVNPLLAIVPFLAAGGTENVDCGALTQTARSSSAKVTAAQTRAAPRRASKAKGGK